MKTGKEGVKRANRSEEGQGQERTENEPEGERDCKREERAGIVAGAVAGWEITAPDSGAAPTLY